MKKSFNSKDEFIDYMNKHEVTPDENELYCLQHYIEYLYKVQDVDFIRFEKREGPDFELQIGDDKIGLEHTRASCQMLAYADVKLDGCPEGSMLEIPESERFKARKESINKVIRKPEEPLQGVGWGDWGREKFFIKVVMDSIKEKTKKLNKNYTLYPSNELIIYDHLQLPGIRWHYVKDELKNQYIRTLPISFSKIHLITDDTLFYGILK